jgi:hypothetical protein
MDEGDWNLTMVKCRRQEAPHINWKFAAPGVRLFFLP